MYALVILTLGVDDLDGLAIGDEHALVAHLTSHLSIERGMV